MAAATDALHETVGGVILAQGTKKRLFVIDDDSDLCKELAEYFGGLYEVDTHRGSVASLRALREDPPDVVLTEINFGNLDGDAVLRALTGAELRSVPFVVLSARQDFASFEAAHRYGAADFVTKPFLLDELREKLRAATDRRRQRTAGRLKLGALLVASGLLDQLQLDSALARQKANGRRLGEVLVRDSFVSETDLVRALAGQLHLEIADLSQVSPSPAAIGLLPRDFIIRHRLLPFRLDDEGTLVVAMTDPLDVVTLDEIRLRTKRSVKAAICGESAFDEAVTLHFTARGKLKDVRNDESARPADDVALAQDASIIEIVDELISDAVSMKASDIHLEPREDTLHVRCRIDGVLHDLREYPAQLVPGIISRVKIMGDMNIAERRLPQDGRVSLETSGGDVVDLRLASIPSLFGENLTIRVLEVSPLPPTLGSLGLNGTGLQRYEEAIAKPDGGVIICGPTGCGKSTTLYTTLELIKRPETKIYTVEDPIERKLHGVVQTEVLPAIGLTFARALRSLVRADPDVIMVGEVRDLETAMMAADAAVTGHLVFTTLHTNDAPSSISRLIEMGVPPYLVAAAFRCIVAQRLVRRLCKHCRKRELLEAEAWQGLGLGPAPADVMEVWVPVGCAKCFGTGYLGRLGLYKVMPIDDEMRELVARSASAVELARAARAAGVESIRQDGVRKVLEGATSYLELIRVTT
jgi:type IV pilus assembly protein PilB